MSNSSTTTPWIPAGPALLFAPADRPERFAKAAERSDTVILDLEDGCRAENREAARGHIAETELDPNKTIVRVNPANTEDMPLDVAAVGRTAFRRIMLPKVESAADIDQVLAECDRTTPDEVRIIALIETPTGVLNLQEIATHHSVDALFWGAEDLTAALGGTSSRYGTDEKPTPGGGISGHPGGYREVPRHTRTMVLLHAAAAGKVALDSIHADTNDVDGAKAEATDAAASGFTATVSIHPGLVPAIRESYRPTDDQLTWAKKVIEGARTNSGAFAVDGQMIDAPLLRQAEVIEARAASME
ncbi:HpcH/HpaI aldolase/citrate lyase family protein [Corynebacterium auriscanis]|uniref:HpcH/HpaI aldolase/citrate lyase family protein n=1 Tax=Corynebacterium auriscanis TaxID=99807 RepID=UPI003CF05404